MARRRQSGTGGTQKFFGATAAAVAGLSLGLAAVVTMAGPDNETARLFVFHCLSVATAAVGAFAYNRPAASPPPAAPPSLPPEGSS